MPHRLFAFLVVVLCASSAHSQPKSPWVDTFIRHLYERIGSRAEEPLVGVIQLLVTIDRKGWPLECRTEAPKAHLLRFQPTHSQATEPARLASAIERICRSSKYPPAPREYYSNGRLKISIPLVLDLRHRAGRAGVGQSALRK